MPWVCDFRFVIRIPHADPGRRRDAKLQERTDELLTKSPGFALQGLERPSLVSRLSASSLA
eukprot:5805133-Prymnesium_polylepis.1